jgi:hypothetical protein
MEVHHNRAIDQQLQQLYHALGLALALNRTLLMMTMMLMMLSTTLLPAGFNGGA